MSSSTSSHWSQEDVVGPAENSLAYQIILEDQQEGLEAFRRRHERQQRRLQRDLRRIQQLEANNVAVPQTEDQKFKEMEKLQLQEELFLRDQQQQRKEEEILKQQQQPPKRDEQQPVRALSSLLYPTRSISLYPSTEDVSTTTPTTAPPLQRHRSESWVLTSRRNSSSSSVGGFDPTLSSPFSPRPTRPVGWSLVDEEGCLVMDTASTSSLQSEAFPSSPASSTHQRHQQQVRQSSPPPPRIPRPGRRRPGGPDVGSDDRVTQAPLRRGDSSQSRLPPPPPQPSRTVSHPNLKPSRRSSPPPTPNRRSFTSPSSPLQQEKMYRKIVPIFPQVPAERILQLVREQHDQQLQHGDDDEIDEERLLSTILSILAEESIPLPEDELASLASQPKGANPRECQCCYTEWSESDCPVMVPCTGSLHVFCIGCVKKYVEEVVFGGLPIPESVRAPDEVSWVLPCMYAKTTMSHQSRRGGPAAAAAADNQDLCRHGLDDLILQHVLPAALWEPYQDYQVRRALLPSSSSHERGSNESGGSGSNDQLLHCQHCNVPCLVSLTSSSQNMACPSCGRESNWSTASRPSAAAAATNASSTARSSRVDDPTASASQLDEAGRHYVEEAMTQNMLRNCPRCARPFVKESGCHKMKCPMCRTASCYICRQVLPWKGYSHFCTHEQHNEFGFVGCVECGPKCPLWSSEPAQEEAPVVVVEQPPPRPVSQRRASSRTRRGLRRMDLPEIPPAAPQSRRSFGDASDTANFASEEEVQRRQAAWEAAQEVWEQNLLTSGQEVRVNVDELVGVPPPRAGLGPRQWTR